MTRLASFTPWLPFTFLSLSFACSQTSSHVEAPVPPGTLREPIALHVTSAKRPSLLFNSVAFAELLDARARARLKERSFRLKEDGARQHLVVHVREAGRGTGHVRFFCEFEVYVYANLPGPLGFGRNRIQDEKGAVAGERPLLQKSLRIENHRRSQKGSGGELRQGADYCAGELSVELARLRDSALPLVVTTPSEASEPTGEANVASLPGKKPAVAPAFEIVRRLDVAPGNLTLTPNGRIIVSLHQFFRPNFPVAWVDEKGGLHEFAQEAHLDSVLGVQSDENGVVWMLDNGMKATHRARLVGYHSVRQRVVADIDLTLVMPKDAFFNDLVIDLDHQVAYLADPAGGANAALVIVDLPTGKARRVLEGHKSVIAEDIELVVEGAPLEIERPDGSVLRPRVGLNPIAADKNNEWLYFGPMHGTTLYRVPTAALRDENLSEEALAKAVERFSERPITDGISIDDDGNIYLADLPNNGVVRVSSAGVMTTLARGPELSWVDAFSFGPDGALYAVVNQLHKSAPLNRGKDVTTPPFLVVKLKTEVGGTVGR
jgi:sugar lactone lactonase YvrE